MNEEIMNNELDVIDETEETVEIHEIPEEETRKTNPLGVILGVGIGIGVLGILAKKFGPKLAEKIDAKRIKKLEKKGYVICRRASELDTDEVYCEEDEVYEESDVNDEN